MLCSYRARTKTDIERLEYLLSRKRTLRAPAERHSVYHVISYQRRVSAIKDVFFKRGCKTPLVEMENWWVQTLAALT